MRIPSYQEVIAEARVYRQTNSHDDWAKAEQILRQGLIDHPYALPIGDELVLILEKQGKDLEGLKLLQELASRFRDPGEETLCRFGKIYKKRADANAASNPEAAIPNLAESERYYGLAYEKSYGFYPRINQLTARFLRASLLTRLGLSSAAAPLLLAVREQAAAMLSDPAIWQARLDDDFIWIPATQGEANFLLGRWQESESAYREAMRLSGANRFYFECMQTQVQMLLDACGPMQITPPSPFNDPAAFFQFPERSMK